MTSSRQGDAILKPATRPASGGLVARSTAALLAAALLTSLVGCPDPKPVSIRQPGGAIAEGRTRTAAFDAATAILNDLPRETNLRLRPPIVVVDASTSRDRRTVEAVLRKHPEQPTGPNNLLIATSRNGRFRTLVEPGDVVRYYVNQDQYGKFSAVDFTVYQVLDDDTLLTTQGLEEPVTTRCRVEIWRYSGEKMRELDQRLDEYVRTGRPSIGWQPSPDEAALRQITEWLNQWSRGIPADEPWQADPLLATLSDDLRALAPDKNLAQTRFEPGDGRFLQQAIWTRDVARWVTADATDDLHAATLLFDWTVRNVHLETRKNESDPRRSRAGLAYRPWQAMLHGRGTAAERAWVFAQLCRQKGLDVVMLSFGPSSLPEELRAWLPALLLNGKLYLFDPELGLPIPGPNRQGVATLEEAVTDDAILRQLDIDETQRYPLKSSDLVNAVAFVPASPGELSRRMQRVEANLAGNQKVRLAADPSSVVKALSEVARIENVQLWPFPWQTVAKQRSMDEAARQRAASEFSMYAWRPRLWKGRVSHLQGNFDGPDDAIDSYRRLRQRSDKEIAAANKSPKEKALIKFAKMHASYWLGIVTFELGNYDQSIDDLKRRTIDAMPNGPWTESARYNLARAHEALGQTEEAIALYEQDQSAQQYGNRLRAHWLKTTESAQPDDKSTPSPGESSSNGENGDGKNVVREDEST